MKVYNYDGNFQRGNEAARRPGGAAKRASTRPATVGAASGGDVSGGASPAPSHRRSIARGIMTAAAIETSIFDRHHINRRQARWPVVVLTSAW